MDDNVQSDPRDEHGRKIEAGDLTCTSACARASAVAQACRPLPRVWRLIIAACNFSLMLSSTVGGAGQRSDGAEARIGLATGLALVVSGVASTAFEVFGGEEPATGVFCWIACDDTKERDELGGEVERGTSRRQSIPR